MSLDLETVSQQLRVALHEAADQLPSEPRVWEPRHEPGRSERRESRVVALAMACIAALVIGFIVWPHDATNTISTPASGSHRVVFDARGDTIKLPSSWARARSPLAPELVDPKELLSVATFPLDGPLRNGGCVGNAPPTGALATMRKKDAFVWMVEWYANASTNAPRPSHFTARQFEPRACVHRANPQLTGRSIFFSDHGRNINVFVVTGNRVSSKRERQLYALLDSLRFSD